MFLIIVIRVLYDQVYEVEVTKWFSSLLLPHVLSTDATVHPPVSETHPYEGFDPAKMAPGLGYTCKMVDGVVHVYTHK